LAISRTPKKMSEPGEINQEFWQSPV
jgi:hypothetical protein